MTNTRDGVVAVSGKVGDGRSTSIAALLEAIPKSTADKAPEIHPKRGYSKPTPWPSK